MEAKDTSVAVPTNTILAIELDGRHVGKKIKVTWKAPTKRKPEQVKELQTTVMYVNHAKNGSVRVRNSTSTRYKYTGATATTHAHWKVASPAKSYIFPAWATVEVLD